MSFSLLTVEMYKKIHILNVQKKIKKMKSIISSASNVATRNSLWVVCSQSRAAKLVAFQLILEISWKGIKEVDVTGTGTLVGPALGWLYIKKDSIFVKQWVEKN